MKHLIVCSPTYVSKVDSILLSNANYNSISDGVYHTSLGDISPQNLLALGSSVDSIEFIDDATYDATTYLKTRIVLNHLSHTKTIKNFTRADPTTFLDTDVSSSNEQSLWVFGCSFSHGIGVNNSERYPVLLSQSLNLPLRSITKPASSTGWSLRHLMDAEFGPNDIVVWQLSTFSRVSLSMDKTKFHETLLKDAPKPILMAIDDLQLYADQLSLLRYGVQVLRAKNVKFKIISLDSDDDFQADLLNEYSLYPEYCYMGDWVSDLGSDGTHPGRLSHLTVANALVKLL